MALQIDTTLTSKDGASVPSGAIVKFQTIFPYEGTQVHYNMKFYRSQGDYDAGAASFLPEEVSKMGHVKSLSQAEYDALTPTKVHNHLHDHLESILGADTVSIIS